MSGKRGIEKRYNEGYLLDIVISSYLYIYLYLASFFPSEWLKSNKQFVTKSFPMALLPLLLPPSNSKQLAEKSLVNEEPRIRRYLKLRKKKSKYVLESFIFFTLLSTMKGNTYYLSFPISIVPFSLFWRNKL